MRQQDPGVLPAIDANINRLFGVKEAYPIVDQLMAQRRQFTMADQCEYWYQAGKTAEFLRALGQTPALQYNFLALMKGEFPHNDQYRNLNGGVPAVICNELDVKTTLQIVENTKPTPVPANMPRVGIMVGEAHILSMLPELCHQVDVMILADFDALVTQHILYQIFCLRLASDYQDYCTHYLNYLSNPVILAKIPAKNISTIDPRTGQAVSMPSSLNAPSKCLDMQWLLHCIASNWHKLNEYSPYGPIDPKSTEGKKIEERFQRCKVAANKIKFVAAPCDFFNPDSIQSLQRCLVDDKGARLAEITYMNLSNLQHYDCAYPLTHCMHKTIRCRYNNRLMPNLRLLLKGQKTEPLILYSTSEYKNGNFQTLHSRVVRGLDKYEVAIFEDVRGILKLWDQAHPTAKNIGVFPTITREIAEEAQKSKIAESLEECTK